MKQATARKPSAILRAVECLRNRLEEEAYEALCEYASRLLLSRSRLSEFCMINNSWWFVDRDGNRMYHGDGSLKHFEKFSDALNEQAPSLFWNVAHLKKIGGKIKVVRDR